MYTMNQSYHSMVNVSRNLLLFSRFEVNSALLTAAGASQKMLKFLTKTVKKKTLVRQRKIIYYIDVCVSEIIIVRDSS